MPRKIDIQNINASDRLRPTDPNWIEAIAASIEEKGLKQAILIRPVGDSFTLVAGCHRLDAMKLLGWPVQKRARSWILRLASRRRASPRWARLSCRKA